MQRQNRQLDQLRETKFHLNYTKHAEGSVLIEMGDTKVICTATIEENLPSFKKGSGSGWVTAEYSMLPRSTNTRNQRDINKLKQSPRSVEIQRLIARALRASINLTMLGERSIIVDCDVIQADGGTRTASITGGFVALYQAISTLKNKELIKVNPIIKFVSAVSVGIVDNYPMLDLCYEEDSKANVDMNVVMTDTEEFVEVQGTGENGVFSRQELNILLDLAIKGNSELIELQRKCLQPYIF